MRNQPIEDRLSWGDSVFLNLERDGMPLNVACLSVFEGDLSFDEYLRFVESRLPLIPRYLKRVVAPPLNAGLPNWDYDPDFDIRNHIREATLKHGTDAELKALSGKILSKVMDRQRPLWDMTLVRGLRGNRSGLIARMHHCLADGIAGVGIMSVLMDPSPATPALPKRKRRLRIPSPLDPVSSLVESVTSSYSSFMDRVLSAWANMLNITERTIANGVNPPSEDISRYMPEVTSPTERLFFNAIYRGPQRFACTETSLDEIKAIRKTCGASVNDVLLALVTATIRRYSELHGERVKGRLFRVMVPVNLRGNDTSPSQLGNCISLVPVTIPLDIRNPKKLLTAVHRRTEFLKRTHAAEFVSLASGLIAVLPNPLQAFVGPQISRLPITPFNMVCTSVPGPQFPLYLLGHKMLQWYPYVPIGGELALNCAILSYNGMVYFGFSGDVHISPDLNRLEKLLQLSFSELRDAVGLSPCPPRTKRTRTIPKQSNKQEKSPSSTTQTLRIPISLPAQQPAVKSNEAPRPISEDKPVLMQKTA
jgi:diacylglycerol O-acyltransferase / wax synthase